MADATLTKLVDQTDRDTVLGEDDLFDLIQELEPLKHRWRSIGLGLRLRSSTLAAIETTHRMDLHRCLEEMLGCWIRKEYDAVRFGPPNWSQIVFAVGIHIGGSNASLAEKISSNHRKGERFSTNDASRDGPYKPPERNQHNAGALRPAEHAPGTSGPPERVPETSRPAEHVPETTRPAKRAPVTSRAAEHNPSASRPARPEPALASKLGERPKINHLNPLKYLDKNGEKQRLRVLNILAAKNHWRDVGHKLGVRVEDLDIIEASTLKDPKRCAEGMIGKWLMSGDCPTWEKLIEAIDDADLKDLGDCIREALPTLIP